MQNIQFPVLVIVSYLVFVILVRVALRRRRRFTRNATLALGVLIVCGGMVFAKYGAMGGLPWWIYYTVPMLLTVFAPPLFLHMRAREYLEYMVLSFTSAPTIHVCFSFFFGWKSYMPFIKIPSIWEL